MKFPLLQEQVPVEPAVNLLDDTPVITEVYVPADKPLAVAVFWLSFHKYVKLPVPHVALAVAEASLKPAQLNPLSRVIEAFVAAGVFKVREVVEVQLLASVTVQM